MSQSEPTLPKTPQPGWEKELLAFLQGQPAAILESVPKHITQPGANWDTSRFDLTTLSSGVSQYHFVAHLNSEHQAGRDGNRWSLSLQTGDDTSVTVTVVPGDEGMRGKITLENETAARTQVPSAAVVSARCPNDKTRVCDILDLIIREKRDQYVFAAGGAGGRWWMNEFVQDMFEHGYLQGYYLDDVRRNLVRYWPSPVNSAPVIRQWAVGKFCE
ncbi:unnamed protein product [Peniophora sp. CBMAI 1063]|nr:unnamed protein product [Peniophora sp. CBMAI 1063]